MEVFWSFISFENKMVSEYLDGVIQKQPNDDLRKRCSKNMEQIYRFSKHLFLKTALGNCFWVIGWMRSKLTLKTLKWRQTIWSLVFITNDFSSFSIVIETVAQRCSVTKVFWRLLENSQEINCIRVSFF